MTKEQAFEFMLENRGSKVCHQYYSDDEYVFINENGEFETEDGYTHGGIYDEFWGIYQKWEDGWKKYESNN